MAALNELPNLGWQDLQMTRNGLSMCALGFKGNIIYSFSIDSARPVNGRTSLLLQKAKAFQSTV
jgi:hypothetical protein